MTVLLDVVDSAIGHMDDVHQAISEDNVPEHTLFVITTGGMENASREYTADAVGKMIQEYKENVPWMRSA